MDDADTAAMNIHFPAAPRSGDVALEGKNIQKSYGQLNVLDGVNIKLDRGDRVAFVGQNGQGKTTLAKILINELPATGGEVKLGHNIHIGYYAQNQSETLQSNLTVLQVMENASPEDMRTKLRGILGAFLFSGEDVDKKISVLSGGERARLAMAILLLRPVNLLVLDEPTNHLDIISKDVLKKALQAYDGTLIVVSHDREFLGDLTSRTIEFRDKQLFNHLGDVNFFLEKRKMENMRQVELSKSKHQSQHVDQSTGEGPIAKIELSFEERKRLNRLVSNAEKKIERIETDIAKMEEQMADPGFYSDPKSTEILAAHKEKKEDLDQAMEEWEEAQLALEG